MVEQVESGSMDVLVRNLGGIEHLETTVEPGVTVLVGRNATNRTSFLQSVVAALGGSAGELRGSAEEGHVRLEAGGEVATREFERRDGAVHVAGEPYTDEADVVDLFASLLEENRARRAVERADGDELREIVMAPIDTAALQDRIASTRREMDSVERRLQEIDRQLGNLPALEQRRRERADELADVESELAEVRAAVEEAGGVVPDATDDASSSADDVSPAASGGASDATTDSDEASDADDLVAELQAAREELERVRDDRETQAEAVASTEDELADVTAELEDLDVPDGDAAELESELEALQRRERELSATVSNLLSIVEFNEELVEGAAELPLAEGADGAGAGDPTSALDPQAREIDCWTCGTSVERAAVSERLDDLRAVIDEKRAERDDVAERIEEARAALAELRERGERRDQLRERREEIEAELERRRERVAALEERATELDERVEELQTRVEDVESDSAERAQGAATEQLERYERISELEYERGQLEEELDRLDEEIDATEALADERDQLEDQREELSSELESLRGRVEAVETAAIDTFNDHVASVLELLEYENVERVWIERRTSADGASTFELHVVRADQDGSVYEDTVEHLSESEREVLGLVVALAGYLVHDVHETVPVMVLDSLEAIDADRIAALVEYLAEHAPYLLVALLPEDAQALSPEYDRVRMGASERERL